MAQSLTNFTLHNLFKPKLMLRDSKVLIDKKKRGVRKLENLRVLTSYYYSPREVFSLAR